jgi:beta-mannosidase
MPSRQLDGWEVASSPPGACATPHDLGELSWLPATVPGTAAAALGADGRDFDAEDWWFRTRFDAEPTGAAEQVLLELDGLATVAETFLNGQPILQSESMWAAHRLDVTGLLGPENELAIVCRALGPLLAARRRPRARWRTRVVADGNLRWYRTMMFGRSPGFAPGPAAVGPWRPVRLTRHTGPWLAQLALRPRLEGADGVLSIAGRLRAPRGMTAPSGVRAALGERTTELRRLPDGTFSGELRVGAVEPWWPHTHGEPTLHVVSLEADGVELASRRVGFRSLRWTGDPERDGLDLHVNDVPVFARGAVWTPPDLISMAPSPETLRALLERVRRAGMNLLRVVGTGAYESPAFHDLCDELGILVWQDFMFANLDYPTADPGFSAAVRDEVREVLAGLAGRPSLAVVAGNSEVEQQAAMLGLDPALGRDGLWEQTMPQLLGESGADAAYVRSTPVGGDLPFHADAGITHYFGVSGYFRPPSDARRAEVRFAAECLAFANVPDNVEFPVHHPRWKAGVPRDAGTGWDSGAGWDFDDVRDFYLGLLHGVDPVQLRRVENERYLELSRAVSGEVMAEVMGEWRRERSPCRGALVLWLKDMAPGAGLGVLDHSGAPKVAYHHLRRALAPVAVWMTDEGVNGVAVHVANDRAEQLRGRLRVALYRNFEAQVEQVVHEIEVPARGSLQRTVEGLLGHYTDAAWAYRFGPPTHDLIVASIEVDGSGPEPVSQSIFFPAGRPTARDAAAHLGLEAGVRRGPDGDLSLALSSRRLAYGVRIHVSGYEPDDDAFCVEPGGERVVALRRLGDGEFGGGQLSALNLDGFIRILSLDSE